MSRVPIRLRLTAGFALAMLVLLAASALFLHLRLANDLDESIDASLESRSHDLASLAGRASLNPLAGGPDDDESFAAVFTRDGRVVAGSGAARGTRLTPEEVRRAAGRPLTVERHVTGIEGTARMHARPAVDRDYVVVAGTTLEERDETLSGQLASFAVSGPIAILLASLAGYVLAGLGLRPVEAMRARAERVSLEHAGEPLPLPEAHDEIRRLGETLNAMLARLRASFERERRFVADASHELRTPLAVLKTELEAALRGDPADPDTREGLTAALEEVDHLVQLADDLLLLARAGEGRLTVAPEDVDVRELLERACERFEDRARGLGRAIVVQAPPDLRARLDPLRMRQALGNLVDNALRHGAGTVTLAASPGLVVEVRDEGEGIPADVEPFERFTRGSTSREGGSGLGLAIVREIARAHGGEAELVPGRAGVRLSLPSQPPASG